MLRLPESTRAKFGPNLKLTLKYKRASGQPTEVEGRPSPHLPRGGPSYSCLSCHLQEKGTLRSLVRILLVLYPWHGRCTGSVVQA